MNYEEITGLIADRLEMAPIKRTDTTISALDLKRVVSEELSELSEIEESKKIITNKIRKSLKNPINYKKLYSNKIKLEEILFSKEKSNEIDFCFFDETHYRSVSFFYDKSGNIYYDKNCLDLEQKILTSYLIHHFRFEIESLLFQMKNKTDLLKILSAAYKINYQTMKDDLFVLYYKMNGTELETLMELNPEIDDKKICNREYINFKENKRLKNINDIITENEEALLGTFKFQIPDLNSFYQYLIVINTTKKNNNNNKTR